MPRGRDRWRRSSERIGSLLWDGRPRFWSVSLGGGDRGFFCRPVAGRARRQRVRHRRGRSQAREARPDPFQAPAPRPLLRRDGQGPADAARAGRRLSRRDHARWRRSPGSSRRRSGRRRSAGRTRGSSGPAATTASGISRRAPRSARSTSSRSCPPHPSQAYGRENRFRYLGLVNEPCFKQPTAPTTSISASGSTSATRTATPDPYADAEKYPGVKIGARGKTGRSARVDEGRRLPVGSYYGEPTGVIGLRLFPNPDFDAEAAERWDPERFYTDPDYYNDKDLVRPYRVGMSCAFCHVGPNPITRPKDAGKPRLGRADLQSRAPSTSGSTASSSGTPQPRGKPGEPAPERGQLPLPAVPHQPARLARHLARLDRLHEQSAHHERGLRGHGRLGMRRRPGRETLKGDERDNKQFQDYPQTRCASHRSMTRAPAKVTTDARAEGRRRLRRNARRAQPRLPQHRPVQRGVAAAFPPVPRRPEDLADPHRRCAEELGLLAAPPRT